MKLCVFISTLLIVFISSASIAGGFAPDVTKNNNNIFAPIVRGHTASLINSAFGMGGAVELGARHYRVSGTTGLSLGKNGHDRIKLTAEYLREQVDIDFYSGVVRRYVQQGALGVGYSHLLSSDLLKSYDISTYYSRAPSQALDTITGRASDTMTYTNERRIAGSDAYGFETGTHLNPWHNGDIKLGINYDHVAYDTKFVDSYQAAGLGASIGLNQLLPYHFAMDISHAMRKPFRDYRSELSWNRLTPEGLFSIGVFGSYIDGRRQLADSATIGMDFGYQMGTKTSDKASGQSNAESLLSWLGKPAVYMPRVLVIGDQRTTFKTNSPPDPACTPITVDGGSYNIMMTDDDRNLDINKNGDAVTVHITGGSAPIDYYVTTDSVLPPFVRLTLPNGFTREGYFHYYYNEGSSTVDYYHNIRVAVTNACTLTPVLIPVTITVDSV